VLDMIVFRAAVRVLCLTAVIAVGATWFTGVEYAEAPVVQATR
jgi:hypothetical protein